MSILDDDLDAIFAGDELFTTCGEFTLSESKTVCINGIFTDASDQTVMYGVEIEAQAPTFVCKTSDLMKVKNRMAVEIKGSTYTVEKITKVGQGSSVVYLKT